MASVAALMVRIKADVSDLNNKLEEANKKFRDAGRGFQDVGQRLALGITLPVVGAGLASLKMAGDFEKSMAEVSTLVSDKDMMGPLTESVKNLSSQFGKMPTEQAAALYQIISAGATTAAQATDILTVSNKLAIGGVTDVKTAADGLTTILNAYGKEAGTATDVSDAMFVAMRAGKTTIGELAASIGMVAPLSAQAGVKLEEVLAATAAVTKGGVSTNTAMAGLRQVLAAVVKPSSEAADMAETLGLQFDAAALKSKGLAGFLADVAQKTGGSTEKMAQLFGGVEALVPVLALTGKASGDFGAILGSMSKKAGETDEAFAKMSKTAAFKFDQMKGAMARSAVEIGLAILPALLPILEAVAGLAARFAELPAPAKTAIIAFGGLAAALGPVMIGIGTLIAAAPAMAIAWVAITGPVGLAVIAFAAVAAAVVGVKKAFDNWDAIKRIAAETYAGIKEWLFDKFMGIVGGIGKLVGRVTGFFRDMWDKVVGNSYVPDMVKEVGVEFAKLQSLMVKPADEATKRVMKLFSMIKAPDLSLATGGGMPAGVAAPDLVLRRSTIGGPPAPELTSMQAGMIRAGMVFEQVTTRVATRARDSFSSFGDAATGVLASFTPMGMAATLLSGLFEGLAPLMGALQEPLRMVGEILGSALAPVLKALFPVFKLVAIAATYVGEVFFKVVGWLNTGIGKLLEGVGRLLNKLPGSIGNPLIQAGQAMQAMGRGFDDGAKALREGREQLKEMEWEDALAKIGDTANRVSEQLQNVPQGFKVALHRFNATVAEAATPTARYAAFPAQLSAPQPVTIQIGDIHVTESGDPRETTRAVIRGIQDGIRSITGEDARALESVLSSIY